MIGNSGISSYEIHSHEHNVTKCLHRPYDTKLKSGDFMSGESGSLAGTGAKVQEHFSVMDLLSEGWGKFFSKSAGLFGRIWGSGQEGDGYGNPGKSGIWNDAGQEMANIANAAEQADPAGRTATIGQTAAEVWGNAGAQAAAAAQAEGGAIMAAATVRLQEEEKRETGNAAGIDKKAVPAVKNLARDMAGSQGRTADGEFRKGEKDIRKFLQRFGKTAIMGKQLQEEREKEEAELLDEGKKEEFLMGDSSYLLDSYNRSGEYSTLAKDRSLEGSFRTLA